jgi:hypothetical protein
MRHDHKAESFPDGTVSITVRDPLDGEWNTVNVKQADYDRWMAGAHVQDAFPYLDIDQREILITGHDAESWDKLFGSDDA